MSDNVPEHRAKKPKIASPQPDLPKPPSFTLPSGESSDLLSRLNAFLPELQAANEKLDSSLNMEQIDSDDEQYIEMNLGLGVLKQIRPGKTDVSSDEEPGESSESSEDEQDDEDTPMANVSDPPLALLMASKRHGKGPRGEPLLSEIRDTAVTPTPDRPEGYAGSARQKAEIEREKALENLLNASKRHGKGPRGKPVIEELEVAVATPTPEQSAARQDKRDSVDERSLAA